MPARTTGSAATATPISTAPAVDASDAAGKWSRRAQSFGRWGVFAIPVYALFAGLTQRDRDVFSTDPTVYAHYREHGRFTPWELVATLGLGVFGVLALIALTALLIRGRGRTLAVIGLVLGVIGSAALMVTLGSVIVRADGVRSAFFGGHWSKIEINADLPGKPAGMIVAGGAVALMLGWMLLGVAVWRTRGLNRADGVMLIVSAPLLYIGGMALRVLPTMGSFLLLAAGLGIAAQARRAILAVDAPAPVAVTSRSRTYSRLVGADVYAASEDLEEFERDFDGTTASEPVGGVRDSHAATGGASGALGGAALGGAALGAAAVAGAAKAASPRHADRGVIGRVKSTRGISIAWPVTRRRRDDASRPAVKADATRPESTKGTNGGKPADATKPAADATGPARHAAALDETTTAGSATPTDTAAAAAVVVAGKGAKSASPANPSPAVGAAGEPVKPKTGLMGALAAIFNGTMTLGRKAPEPTPPPTGPSAVAGRPAAQFGLAAPDRARLDGTKVTPPTITTTPAGRATTPSLSNRVPGATTPASAKATNAANNANTADPKPHGKRGGHAKGTNAKGGKGKPGQG